MKKLFIVFILLLSLFMIVAFGDYIDATKEKEDEFSELVREVKADELEPEETFIGSLIHKW